MENELKKRNRIVIVGNGFDLAHGLKSQYGDFLKFYLKEKWDKRNHFMRNNQPVFEDDLVKLFLNKSGDHFENQIQNLFEQSTSFKSIIESGLISFGTEFKKSSVRFEFKSRFINEIVKDQNWSDFEATYFNLLEKNVNELKINNPIPPDELNKDFEKLRLEFINYLNQINSENDRSILKRNSNLEFLIDKFYYEKNLSKNSITSKSKSFYDLELNEVKILNFNYTDILSDYLGRRKNDEIKIHGTLSISDNIVFGYGDEQNESYQIMEKTGDNEYLKYQKSSYYSQNNQYQRLLNAIELPYDVFVIGHSLGLSDRILLKTIFENDNCNYINLCYRGGQSGHFKSRMNLSRHFSDKSKLRERLLYPFDEFEIK